MSRYHENALPDVPSYSILSYPGSDVERNQMMKEGEVIHHNDGLLEAFVLYREFLKNDVCFLNPHI